MWKRPLRRALQVLNSGISSSGNAKFLEFTCICKNSD